VIVALLASPLAFMACSQEEVVKPVTSVATSQESSSARPKWPKRLKAFKCVDNECTCLPRDGNCLPTVVITPSYSGARLITALLDTVRGGNQEFITKYLLENQKELSEYIETEAILAVINQELTLKVFTNEGDSELVYLLFNSQNGTIEVVYPFQFTK
jgi:hypothetical protein